MATAAEIVNHLATWKVYTPDARAVGGAIRLGDRFQISSRDALIVHAAITMEALVLRTEDLGHGQFFDEVSVTNPFR
jgi:predicted nucleic acid-binding protein